ncbi:MAG: sigma-70 family RNA polymerase sigma factor [Romboutsia sp.]
MRTEEELESLVNENIGLVKFTIKKKFKKHLKKIDELDLYEDFYQEGCIGLFKAAKVFDESRGNKFSTVGVRWIELILRNFLARYVYKHYRSNVMSMDKEFKHNEESESNYYNLVPNYDKYDTGVYDLKNFAKQVNIKDIDKVIDLSLEGFSQKEIGEKFGVSQAEISRRLMSLKNQYEIHAALGELVRINKAS